MNTAVKAAFPAAGKPFVRVAGGESERRHTSCHNTSTAEVMRAQALLLGHLYKQKHQVTRGQLRALVYDMLDWADAMDAKEQLAQALAERAPQPVAVRKPVEGRRAAA